MVNLGPLAELVDARVSKTRAFTGIRVRFSEGPPLFTTRNLKPHKARSAATDSMKDIEPKLDPQKVEKKLQLAAGLFALAFRTKCFQLRQKYPELSEREINHRAYALIERGCA